jgi:hypothetical protein
VRAASKENAQFIRIIAVLRASEVLVAEAVTIQSEQRDSSNREPKRVKAMSKISANKAMVRRGKKARKSTGQSSRASQAEVPFRPQVIEVDDGYATVFVGGLGPRKK